MMEIFKRVVDLFAGKEEKKNGKQSKNMEKVLSEHLNEGKRKSHGFRSDSKQMDSKKDSQNRRENEQGGGNSRRQRNRKNNTQTSQEVRDPREELKEGIAVTEGKSEGRKVEPRVDRQSQGQRRGHSSRSSQSRRESPNEAAPTNDDKSQVGESRPARESQAKERTLNRLESRPTRPKKEPQKKYTGELSEFFKTNLSEIIQTNLHNMGIGTPTEIQEQSIVLAKEGKSLICVSQTGSGKTLAFLLPILENIATKVIGQGLIICPTREIAIQIASVVESVGRGIVKNVALIIGGESYGPQKESLRNYPDLIIGTPGRLVDMIQGGFVWLEYTEVIVLDEADRMLDMGFEKELTVVMNELKALKQWMFFTATFTSTVEKMAAHYAKKYDKSYEKITLSEDSATNSDVTHTLIRLKRGQNKDVALKEILKQTEGKVIVFFNSILQVKNKQKEFSDEIKGIVAIHSGKDQDERRRVIRDFTSGKKRILFGTDVISRGVDVPSVEMVINYDLPNQPEDYVHRIGRTGRAGQSGIAKTLCSTGVKDRQKIAQIEKIIKTPLQWEDFP